MERDVRGLGGRHFVIKGIRRLERADVTRAEIARFAHRLRSGVGSCVVWTGAKNGDGYGVFRIGSRAKGRIVLVHRLAYAVHRGAAGSWMVVDHTCGNRACVVHLKRSTPEENTPAIFVEGWYN